MFKIISICYWGWYQYCKTEPNHPKANSNGLYPLHRVLVENKIWRLLTNEEVIHHIDFNKNNNFIENLQILTKEEHGRIHSSIKIPIECECWQCWISFEVKPHSYRLRLKRSKHNKIFCSRKCWWKYEFNK